MAAAKGTMPPNAGKGRKPGTPNKFTIEIKSMVEQALHEAGGVKYLAQQAEENPAAFLALVGKLVPRDLNHKVTHTQGGFLVEFSGGKPVGEVPVTGASH